MRCPSCGFDNPEGMKFCGQCANPLTEKQKTKRIKGQKAKRKKSSSAFAVRNAESKPNPAERRQMTVMFCDLVGSTPLAEKLDPEELREVILAYQEVCAQEIHRFDGYLARYLGDGLLVYFGYPQAHEDDARRAVQVGLEILAALPQLNAQLEKNIGTQHAAPLQVRIGIHTGLVVVGDMGGGGFPDPMAIVGETPNIAARLQGIAEPDTVVISGATHRLVQGLFEYQNLGSRELKGVTTPMPLYRVVGESGLQSRFEVTVRTGLTPLVGRDDELGLLLRYWEKAKAGEGQVVLLTGEAGIGKSRLVQELKERAAEEGYTRIEFRCSPYYQNTAFYPVTEHLQRLLQFRREDSPQEKLAKLAEMLNGYRFSLQEVMPLFAVLLSLPHPDGYPPLTLTPQRQKQRTQEALGMWLAEGVERQPVLAAWEDLQWADPSTLELHDLLMDRVSTARLLTLLTYRPEFSPPWDTRSYLSHITLNRLPHTQVEAMVEKVTGGRSLPGEVLRQIVAKTDGVPLFVEELTKMVLESGFMRQTNNHYELTGPLPLLAIPATLHDSLMARLDRLGAAKEVAQLGATLGREFSYELLQAVSSLEETTLQRELSRLVEAELLYQRGLLPQARYIFKHALIQEAAYQSLLKSKRQQYHQQIAQILEERFPGTVESQPEILAHHYTEASLTALAIRYWRKAGQRASERSAHVEAIAHLTKGLGLLNTLPDTPERLQQELRLQTTLTTPLIATKGYTAPEVEKACNRARELCQQIGETPQLFPVLGGLCSVYYNRAELRTGVELAEQMLRLAQSVRDPVFFLWAHYALGFNLFHQGSLAFARAHLEQSLALYDPQKHGSYGFVQDPGVTCLSTLAGVLDLLGYPDQAFDRTQEALVLARKLSHPFSLAWALGFAAGVHGRRGEQQAAQELNEAMITLSSEQGFTQLLAEGAFWKSWILAEQEKTEKGIGQMRQSLATLWNAGTELGRPSQLAALATVYGRVGQSEEGLNVLAEALSIVSKNGERFYEAELYRFKGELTLQQFNVQGSTFNVDIPQSAIRNLQSEAEEYFHKAIDIARRQSAKSLELRAVMSLSRLWQQQGKTEDARQMLAEIYGWFTEGFDTQDLQEAKAMLEAWSH